MRFGAVDAANALSAPLSGPDVEIDGASFDSRVIRKGQLFVPIVAERDGHDFIGAALAAGAGAYLTSRAPQGGTAIAVGDTLDALQRLARWGRARLGASVVGVTGSVGKTSTKDLLRAALAAGRRTWANERSFNNDQGLPVTILEAPDDTEALVLEMGMRGPGEIARLCAVAAPGVGVVTRVAPAHSERLGGIDGIARAKRELVEALPPSGLAVLNADDPRVRAMASATAARSLLVGESPGSEVRIESIVLDPLARARFRLRSPWGAVDVRLGVSGRHMAANAALALAVAGALGVELEAAAAAVGTARLSAMRMDVRRLANGVLLIDDTYNANPASMRAALDALAGVHADRRVALLGPMAEVAGSEEEHAAVAAYAGALGIEVVAVGTEEYGVAPVTDALAVGATFDGGTAVLVKASRSAGLDRLAAALVVLGGGVEEDHVAT